MPEQFKGVVGRYASESKPWWPQPPRANEGAPNILYIVLDDVGYGQLSSFGGLCETPNLDRLTAPGLPAGRPEPPFRRDGRDRGILVRLPGAQRGDPVRERLALRDAYAPRVLGLC